MGKTLLMEKKDLLVLDDVRRVLAGMDVEYTLERRRANITCRKAESRKWDISNVVKSRQLSFPNDSLSHKFSTMSTYSRYKFSRPWSLKNVYTRWPHEERSQSGKRYEEVEENVT